LRAVRLRQSPKAHRVYCISDPERPPTPCHRRASELLLESVIPLLTSAFCVSARKSLHTSSFDEPWEPQLRARFRPTTDGLSSLLDRAFASPEGPPTSQPKTSSTPPVRRPSASRIRPSAPRALNRRPFRPSIRPVRRPSASRIVDACKLSPLSASSQNPQHVEPSKTQVPSSSHRLEPQPRSHRPRRPLLPQIRRPKTTPADRELRHHSIHCRLRELSGPSTPPARKPLAVLGPGPSTPPIPKDQRHQLSTPSIVGHLLLQLRNTPIIEESEDPSVLAASRCVDDTHPTAGGFSSPEGLPTPSPTRGDWSLQPGGPLTPRIRKLPTIEAQDFRPRKPQRIREPRVRKDHLTPRASKNE
jgi:hypothetical protein